MIQEVISLLGNSSYRNLFSLREPSKKDLEEIENGEGFECDNDDGFEFFQGHSTKELIE